MNPPSINPPKQKLFADYLCYCPDCNCRTKETCKRLGHWCSKYFCSKYTLKAGHI